VCGKYKERVVDMLAFEKYQDIDLDQTPCIFPRCPHFLTVESLDGIMSMSDHYNLDENGHITSLCSDSKPFDMKELKTCPECRGSMYDIRRYGRIVRRALLDESTKKFIVWSNQAYIPLAESLTYEQEKLANATDKPGLGEVAFVLDGDAAKQLRVVKKFVGGKRYNDISRLWQKINDHCSKVRKEEQPFQRVFRLVQLARLRDPSVDEFRFDSEVLQTRGHILATALLIRCELVILSDAVSLRQAAAVGPVQGPFCLDFSKNIAQCENLIEAAAKSQNPLQEVEGHVFAAQFLCLQRSASRAVQVSENLKSRGLDHIDLALKKHHDYPASTRAMRSEIDAVKHALNDGVFYTPVSNDEMRQVITAMANEFSGTGHWYYCANGHPFTVGECGGPMETSRCPQCDAPVGGRNHQSVEGVRRASELEEQFGQMRL
jgi:hypothetical protein